MADRDDLYGLLAEFDSPEAHCGGADRQPLAGLEPALKRRKPSTE